mgnify:CR=1 FL=1
MGTPDNITNNAHGMSRSQASSGGELSGGEVGVSGGGGAPAPAPAGGHGWQAKILTEGPERKIVPVSPSMPRGVPALVSHLPWHPVDNKGEPGPTIAGARTSWSSDGRLEIEILERRPRSSRRPRLAKHAVLAQRWLTPSTAPGGISANVRDRVTPGTRRSRSSSSEGWLLLSVSSR